MYNIKVTHAHNDQNKSVQRVQNSACINKLNTWHIVIQVDLRKITVPWHASRLQQPQRL